MMSYYTHQYENETLGTKTNFNFICFISNTFFYKNLNF